MQYYVYHTVNVPVGVFPQTPETPNYVSVEKMNTLLAKNAPTALSLDQQAVVCGYSEHYLPFQVLLYWSDSTPLPSNTQNKKMPPEVQEFLKKIVSLAGYYANQLSNSLEKPKQILQRLHDRMRTLKDTVEKGTFSMDVGVAMCYPDHKATEKGQYALAGVTVGEMTFGYDNFTKLTLAQEETFNIPALAIPHLIWGIAKVRSHDLISAYADFKTELGKKEAASYRPDEQTSKSELSLVFKEHLSSYNNRVVAYTQVAVPKAVKAYLTGAEISPVLIDIQALETQHKKDIKNLLLCVVQLKKFLPLESLMLQSFSSYFLEDALQQLGQYSIERLVMDFQQLIQACADSELKIRASQQMPLLRCVVDSEVSSLVRLQEELQQLFWSSADVPLPLSTMICNVIQQCYQAKNSARTSSETRAFYEALSLCKTLSFQESDRLAEIQRQINYFLNEKNSGKMVEVLCELQDTLEPIVGKILINRTLSPVPEDDSLRLSATAPVGSAEPAVNDEQSLMNTLRRYVNREWGVSNMNQLCPQYGSLAQALAAVIKYSYEAPVLKSCSDESKEQVAEWCRLAQENPEQFAKNLQEYCLRQNGGSHRLRNSVITALPPTVLKHFGVDCTIDDNGLITFRLVTGGRQQIALQARPGADSVVPRGASAAPRAASAAPGARPPMLRPQVQTDGPLNADRSMSVRPSVSSAWVSQRGDGQVPRSASVAAASSTGSSATDARPGSSFAFSGSGGVRKSSGNGLSVDAP